jgi:hypothetical protein
VFQPGGTQAGNVYTSWSDLVTAMSAISGPKLLLFDNHLAPLIVPAGTWDVTNVVWSGPHVAQSGLTSAIPPVVTIDDSAILTGLREIRGINFTPASGSSTVPISDLVDGDVFVMRDFAQIGGSSSATAINLISLTESTIITIDLRNGAQLVQGGTPPPIRISHPSAGGTLVIRVDKSSTLSSNTLDDTSDAGAVSVNYHLEGSLNIPLIQSSFSGGQSSDFNNPSAYNITINQAPAQLPVGAINLFPFGGITSVNIPSAALHPGGWLIVKNSSSSTSAITITPGGGTIDGASTYVINTAFGSVTLVADGVSNWNVVAKV